MVLINVSELREQALRALKYQGYSDAHSRVILETLLYAQLRGNNQGVVKLIGNGMPANKDAKPPKIVKQSKHSTLIDGGQTQGMVVLKQAADTAITKTITNGFAIVGTHNTSSSTGSLGFYANEIAKRGYIGLVLASSPPTVCPHGSYESLYGTNPIAIGIPVHNRDPLVLDMATSAMAYFGLVEAKTAGRTVPNDVGFDSDGKSTTDPGKILDGGAIRSFDRSYKGSSLGLIVSILCGPLVKSAYVGLKDAEKNWGNLVICISPSMLVEIPTFQKEVAELLDRVKKAKRLDPNIPITLPGEQGNAKFQETVKTGNVTVDDNLWKELVKAANKGPTSKL